MSITYGGVDLLFPDPEGALQKWLDLYLPLEDLRLWGTPEPWHWSASQSPNEHRDYHQVGLTVPNWLPMPSRMKLNSIWWPTGASRWSLGLFLIENSRLAQVPLNGPLIIKEEGRADHTLGYYAYTLPPRKLSSDLWVLPLVDARYWWQRTEFSFNEEDNWETLLLRVGGILLTDDTISAGYGIPDCIAWRRHTIPLGTARDAVAWNIGKRFVIHPAAEGSSTLRLLSAKMSEKIHAANLAGWTESEGVEGIVIPPSEEETVLVAGGACDPRFIVEHIPAGVRVYFDYTDNNDSSSLERGTGYHTSTYRIQVGNGSWKTFRDTAGYTYSNPVTREESNHYELSALASQIGRDYYDWAYPAINNFYDMTFAGLKTWLTTGFDDAVIYELGSQKDGSYQWQTRIMSLPPDVGVTDFMHQLESCPQGYTHPARWIHVTLNEALATDTSGCLATVVNYWDGDDPDPFKRGIHVGNLPTHEGWQTLGQKYAFTGTVGSHFYASWYGRWSSGESYTDFTQPRYILMQGECS